MQDGSGTAYNNNASITATEDITLYAMWEENIVATLSITNNKFTEGTTVNLGGTAGNNIQNIELKAGNVHYTQKTILEQQLIVKIKYH